LWDALREHISEAKGVRAAVAYFGRNGANLLPLKSGDALVVDASLGQEYRPPKFKAFAERTTGKRRSRRVPEAKLWFLGGLVRRELTGEDKASMERLERRAERKLKIAGNTEVRSISYRKRPRFLQAIRLGDWLVDCTKDEDAREVGPPARVLSEDTWTSSRGKKHAVLMLESPKNGESMTLGQFRRKVRTFEPVLNHLSPRTRPIQNSDHADRILRFWTSNGKIAK